MMSAMIIPLTPGQAPRRTLVTATRSRPKTPLSPARFFSTAMERQSIIAARRVFQVGRYELKIPLYFPPRITDKRTIPAAIPPRFNH